MKGQVLKKLDDSKEKQVSIGKEPVEVCEIISPMTPISFSLLLPVLLPASFSKFRPQKKMIDNLLYGILRSHAFHAARSSS